MKRFFLLALWLSFGMNVAQAETIYQYGTQCAKEVSVIPAFSCMAGEVIPITVGGKTPDTYTPNMTCDKPSLLPATGEGAQGQCLPGTRALVLRDDATAQISAICRKKVVRPMDSHLFDEINIISHNLKNGKTCWFTAQASEPLKADAGIDGRLVPSPTAASAMQGYRTLETKSKALSQTWHVDTKTLPNPKQFWLSPLAVAASKPACMYCHDSGPFMYSPYIAQTTQLPGDPLGKYRPKAVGTDFKKQWQDLTAFGITTRGNTCTTCHRMGNMNSCSFATLQATAQAPQAGGDDWSKKFPESHWMSPGNLRSLHQWNEAFTSSLKKIADCCQNPKANGCQIVDYSKTK